MNYYDENQKAVEDDFTDKIFGLIRAEGPVDIEDIVWELMDQSIHYDLMDKIDTTIAIGKVLDKLVGQGKISIEVVRFAPSYYVAFDVKENENDY